MQSLRLSGAGNEQLMKKTDVEKVIEDALLANGYKESSMDTAASMASVIMYELLEIGIAPPLNLETELWVVQSNKVKSKYVKKPEWS